MNKLGLVLAFLIGSISSAFAACTPPAVMHDFPGTSFNMSLITNASDGNCASIVAVPSGGIVSGAIASGAVASGAYSSGAFASGSYASGSIGSGAMVDLGAIADAAATTGSTGSVSAKLRLMTTQLNTLNTTLGSPFQAGGALAANQSVNLNQYAGNAITCTMTAYGTAPTGNCPGFNAFVTNTVVVDGHAVTQPVSAAAAQIVNGASVAQGSTTDSPCTLPASGTGCSQVAIEKAIANAANSPANLAAAATGGCTPGVILSAASNNSTSIKGSAGTLCELTILQTTTTLMDVRLYDTASAPTCSSATGVVANYVVQSNATSPGITVNLGTFGKAFASGIGVCITGANANNDNTNAATGLNLNYAFK